MKQRRNVKGWTRPAMGSVELNVDASFYEDSGSGALGAIVRDAVGIFIAAVVSYKQHAL